MKSDSPIAPKPWSDAPIVIRLIGMFKWVNHFFPMQLLVNNFKKNQFLLLFWLILFAIVTGNLGGKHGIPYLFLDPEYLGTVSYKATFIIGICLGIYILSFQITSYILDSHKFHFLGTIHFPFTTFAINNSIIPATFIFTYVLQYVEFQSTVGQQGTWEILSEVGAMLLGIFIVNGTFLYYFKVTNKRVFDELAHSIDVRMRRRRFKARHTLTKMAEERVHRYRTFCYVSSAFKFKVVKQEISYDREALLRIIDKHHLNAVSVESAIFVLIIILGLFKEEPVFQIPAAASSLLFFSFMLLFTGFVAYWLRAWTVTGGIILLIALNIIIKSEVFDTRYEAFGLDYQTHKAEYSLHSIDEKTTPELFDEDYNHSLKILENWKSKFPEGEKPKMVFVCLSGGGQRAAVWSTLSLQHLDSLTEGKLMRKTMLMTGSSGGLIGGSYFRELYLQSLENDTMELYSNQHVENISRDILNPMVFSMVVSDLFFRFQQFEVGGHKYSKGRGYAFERQLSLNTNQVLNKRIIDYKEPEEQAKIPMLLLSPTIINDGRKLYISPQPVSYMCAPFPDNRERGMNRAKAIEFMRFFEHQDAEELRFLSALRMNATFPYITPNVVLPSNPAMEIMDAGLSDNFGVSDAVRFIYTFKDWIAENTGGVVILTIRDSESRKEIKEKHPESFWDKLFNPIAGPLSKWGDLLDWGNDHDLEYATTWFKGNLSVIHFEYTPEDGYSIPTDTAHDTEAPERKRASLSWHLTESEKENIQQSLYSIPNRTAAVQLKSLIK